MFFALVLPACTPADLAVADKSGVSDSDRPTIGDTASVDTGDTADSSEPVETAAPIAYDCAALGATPTEDNELDAARAYHDVAFDDQGYIIGWDGRSSLVRATYDDVFEVYAPGFSSVQGIDRLRDGDLVVGDDASQSLTRVSPDGASSVIASGIGAVYGVMVGPDGNVYFASNTSVYRAYPDTGVQEELLSFSRRETPRAVAFSLDNSTMYIATIGSGNVYSVAVDTTLTPTSEAVVFAERVGNYWHDGIGIDACGNVYVPEFGSYGLYRITPDGTVSTLYRGDLNAYGHGIEWGSGLGGWRADALYLPQPYDRNTVREVVIGVPSGNTVRDQL